MVVSINQLVGGSSPDSVNDTMALVVQEALSAFIITVSTLMLLAAAIPRNGLALASEIVGCALGVGGFLVYTITIASTDVKYWATAGFAWALALFGGSVCRGIQILVRGY